MEPVLTQCPRCHGPLRAGHCPGCEAPRGRFVHREVVLLGVLMALAAAAYLLTQVAAAGNRHMRLEDAAVWFAQAQDAERRGDLPAAVTAYRRAATAHPDESRYRLALSRALAANHAEDEATRILHSVREGEPENPDANVQLARIEAGRADVVEARRHYQSALLALWAPDQVEARRQLRIELIRFLLSHGERARALSEIIALTAEAATDPAAQVAAGQLLLQADDPKRAREMFTTVLEARPESREALAGAGEASYRLGDYPAAARFLRAVPDPDETVTDLLAVSELVMTADPLAPRLSMAARQRRLALTLIEALRRMDACGLTERPALQAVEGQVAPRAVAQRLVERLAAGRARWSRDEIEDAFALAVELESAATASCGQGSPLSRATVLIAMRHPQAVQ